MTDTDFLYTATLEKRLDKLEAENTELKRQLMAVTKERKGSTTMSNRKYIAKILPEYFVEVVRGNKTFEVRKDDRPFNVGDELILYEVNCGRYTGRNIKVIITYILRNPDYCKEGYCILGFKQPVKQQGRWSECYTDSHHYSGICSVCGRASIKSLTESLYEYCPKCGARMDGGTSNEIEK